MGNVIRLKEMVVDGIDGIAEAIYKNLAELVKNENRCFSIASDTPQIDDASVEEIRSASTGWYGVIKDRSASFFDRLEEECQTVLYVDYFGGSFSPQVIVLDLAEHSSMLCEEIAFKLTNIFEDEFGIITDRLEGQKFYCELEEYQEEK